METSKRLYELDALRGIAALSVVFFHYTTRYFEIYSDSKMEIPIKVSYGHYGVQLFFIISGFVIYLSLLRSKSVIDFSYKRAVRLYPSYIFSVLLTFTIVSIFGLDDRQVSIKEAILNLSMLQGYIPGVEHVDGVYWSLTIELSFYFIMGLVFVKGLLNKVELVSISWLTLATLLNLLDLQGIVDLIGDKILLINYVHLFIAGMMFYQIRESKLLRYHAILILAIVYDFTFNGIESGVVLCILYIIFYLLIFNKLRFLNSKVFVFMGTISYSFYLVHQNIGYIIIQKFEALGITNEVVLIIPTLTSILTATLITFYIEKPIQKLLQRNKKEKENISAIPV